MYSISAVTTYAIEENGAHTMEVHVKDSDGIDLSAYAEGENLLETINNITEELEDAMADYDDQRADEEEARLRALKEKEEEAKKQAELRKSITDQIAELQAQLDELNKKSIVVNENYCSLGDKNSNKKIDPTNVSKKKLPLNIFDLKDFDKIFNSFEKFPF